MLAMSPLLAWAGTGYKWTDAEGNVHFTQEPPPPDAKVEDTFNVRQTPSEAAPSTDTPASETAPAEKEKKPADDDVTGKTPDELNQQNCQRAQDYLKSLQVEGDVAMQGPDGKLQKLDKAQREKEIEHGQNLVKQYCTPPKAE
jgi:hypothetical protein